MQNNFRMRMRSIRLNDFKRRAEYSPNSVYQHMERGYRYIPVHPFADEPDVLNYLGIDKNECWKVDAWLELDDDACFLQVYSSKYDEYREPGFYARILKEGERWLYLWATTESDCITIQEFENIIVKYVELGAPKKFREQIQPGDGLVLIG